MCLSTTFTILSSLLVLSIIDFYDNKISGTYKLLNFIFIYKNIINFCKSRDFFPIHLYFDHVLGK